MIDHLTAKSIQMGDHLTAKTMSKEELPPTAHLERIIYGHENIDAVDTTHNKCCIVLLSTVLLLYYVHTMFYSFGTTECVWIGKGLVDLFL